MPRRNTPITVLIIFYLLLVTVQSQAAFTLNNRPMVFDQPNGQTIDVLVTGNQFYKHIESIDGYTLTKDPQTDYWCYALLSEDGRSLISSGVPAYEFESLSQMPEKGVKISQDAVDALIKQGCSELDAQASAAKFAASNDLTMSILESSPEMKLSIDSITPYYNATGEKKNLVLLVYFPDENSYDYIDNEGDPKSRTGVDDFFTLYGEERYEELGINGSVREYFEDVSFNTLHLTTEVIAFKEADYDKAYYEDYSSDPNNWDDPTDPTTAPEYYEGARVLIEELLAYSGKAASSYDSIFCYYAGSTSNLTDILPHTSSLGTGEKYAILDLEYNFEMNLACEYASHMALGWGLYYPWSDYYNPVKPNAALRVLSGWITPTEIIPTTSGQTVSINIDSAKIIYNDADPNEYFLVENRYAPDENDRDYSLYNSYLSIYRVKNNSLNYWINYYSGDLGPTGYPNTSWSSGPSDILYYDLADTAESRQVSIKLAPPPAAEEGTIKIHKADGSWSTNEYSRLSDAAGSAGNGDTIFLECGKTYYDNFEIYNKDITIRSYDPDYNGDITDS